MYKKRDSAVVFEDLEKVKKIVSMNPDANEGMW